MLFKGIHNIDYKQKKKEVKPLPIKKKDDIPEGLWFSFETVGFLTGISRQTVHLLYLSEQIKAIKFPKGPMLANLLEVEDLIQQNEPTRI